MGRRSSTTWLLLAYVALVVYGSLYPFGPWEWPGLMPWQAVLSLPWPKYWPRLDIWANALGYAPMGLLAVVSVWRSGGRWWGGLLAGAVAPSLLAYGLEVLQYFVVSRVPSLADWALNTGGAVLGALAAAVLIGSGRLARMAKWRERWFEPNTAGALALLAVWPLGLAFPPPAPLAQGQFVPQLYPVLQEMMAEREWAHWADWPQLRAGATLPEFLATFLGLLVPCCLMLAATRTGWHRLAMLVGALGVGVGFSSLSAAIGFGPEKAWSWPTDETASAMASALVLALTMAWLPARWNAVLGLLFTTMLLAVVNLMGGDPYWEASLDSWTGSRQIRLYGMLQWLGQLWPLLVLAWLAASLARRRT